MKNFHVHITYLLLLALSVFVFCLMGVNKNTEIEHLNGEISLYADSVKNYKIADSLNAATTIQLKLDKHQLEELRAEDMALIKQLKDKTSGLEKYIKAELKSHTKIKTVIKDSIIRDSIFPPISIKAFDYTSIWVDIHGTILNDSILEADIQTRESLIIVQRKRKKKFLFFKLPIWLFGYKTENVDVISKNPNTSITNIEYICVD